MRGSSRWVTVVALSGLALVVGRGEKGGASERKEEGSVQLEAEGGPAPIPVHVTWRGAHSRIAERCQYRITSEKEWVDLWLRHVGYKPEGEQYEVWSNPADVPRVDFDEYMIVAIFSGRSVNCDGMEAVSVMEETECLRFRFRGMFYQTFKIHGEGHFLSSAANSEAALFDGPVHTTPYAMLVVPRSTKPLVLEENVQSQIGAPPAWKERQRFEGLSTDEPE